MAENLVDISESYIKTFVDSIRPADLEIRKQVDFGYTYDGKNFEILEIRSVWSAPEEIQKIPFAKITYTKSKNIWTLYWMRASGKWNPYAPEPTSNTIQKLLEAIKNDATGCFFG